MDEARYGWGSNFPTFSRTPARVIRGKLLDFIRDAGEKQIRAWDESIPPLQREVDEVLTVNESAAEYTTILEYELPMESRRTDVILLAGSAVVVLELKGKIVPSQADIDQAAAYARDLRCYHRECEGRPVVPVVVPTRARGYVEHRSGVHVAGPDAVDQLVEGLEHDSLLPVLTPTQFLAESAYRPLPTLVQAARELFQSGSLRTIHRARAATDPAVDEIARVVHEAAATSSRRLVLLTGVPGAGKTLVGLRVVHAHFLDDLAVPRANGKPTAPAVFLSGNGPLVDVLQYELRSAGGGGRTFVRGVKDYVKRYSSRPGLIPPEHVLVFDEAQRAFDAIQVKAKHANTPGYGGGRSEPEHFVEFAARIPGWCVVLGLIGSGQEIHVGEEAGLVQWRHAVENSAERDGWIVHGPASVGSVFEGSSIQFDSSDALNLDRVLRCHLASDLDKFVEGLLRGDPAEANAALAASLDVQGYHLRITRDLEIAKKYLRERYEEDPVARFGIVASSRDRDLLRFGVQNDYQSTKRIRFGPWYSDDEKDPGGYSCRHLREAVTEFGAQGLELDAVLLAWGTDLVWSGSMWSNARAKGYARGSHVRDPYQLRVNAYRVLLTRGRDATVVFIPPLPEVEETFRYLSASGFAVLS
jgi:hypothetical protein